MSNWLRDILLERGAEPPDLSFLTRAPRSSKCATEHLQRERKRQVLVRWTPLVRQLGWRVKRESRRITIRSFSETT